MGLKSQKDVKKGKQRLQWIAASWSSAQTVGLLQI